MTENFTIAPPSGSSSTATISSGGTASYTLAVTPPSGDKFTSAVSLSISGLPSGATASFSPTSVPAGSGATNITLAINVPSTTAALEKHKQYYTSAAAAVLCIIVLPVPLLTRNKRRAKLFFLLALSFITLGGLNACGGSSNSKQSSPQTYNLTVTATSGPLSNAANLTLTVE